ncbi:MAG: alpha/beta hydrolase [Planctomycetota bacterium]
MAPGPSEKEAGVLPCVEIEPSLPARHSVVWLHGLGADGHDFEPIVPLLGLKEDLAVRFVFPTAPSIPVSINMGFRMPAWYDILEPDLDRRIDMEGVRRSEERIRQLLEREKARGVLAERIVLAGFSQGGVLALHLGLRHPETLAGILGLSCYLIDRDSLGTEDLGANRNTPVFLAHGTFDPMVPVSHGEQARRTLEARGYPAEWHTYPMEHQVCPEEIKAMGSWLDRCFRARG